MSVEAIYHRRQTRRPVTVSGLFPAEHGRIERRGRFFYDSQGQIWGYRAKSMFLLFLRYCRGEDITPDLCWLRAFGFNVARVFGPLPWKETPDYRVESFQFNKLPGFFALLEAYGLRCNWSLAHYVPTFADEDEEEDWIAAVLKPYVQRWFDIAQDFWSPTFAEAVNEPHVGSEKPDPGDLLRDIDRHGIVTSFGLYGEYYDNSTETLPKCLDFGEIHTQRDSAWVRKARHGQELQQMLGYKNPWVLGEPAKAIEIGSAADHPPTTAVYPGFNYPGGKTNPDDFARHHAVGHLWLPGSCVHDEHGKFGTVPPVGSQQYRCAEAVRDHVWLKLGPDVQTGDYNRGGNSDSPVDNVYTEANQMWTYSSLHADTGKAWSVRCGSIPLKAINGWRIVETWLGGTIARLER